MRTRIGWLPIVATLAFGCAGTPTPDPRLVVGIARTDGRIVPFAAYDSGRWASAWPDPRESIDRIPALNDAPGIWRSRGEPVSTAWRAWPSDSPVDARVTGIDVVTTHCQKQIALTTDLASTPRLAMAIDSTTVSAAAVRELTRADAPFTDAERVVIENVERLERAEAQRNGRPLPDESPRPAPQVTHLYQQAASPRSPMYFVAEKKYRTPLFPEDPACNALTIVTGWLMPSDGALALVSPRVFVTNCDAKGTRTALPLGAIRISNRLFWAMQEHGYEDDSHVIAEIGETEVRYAIEANGGGC